MSYQMGAVNGIGPEGAASLAPALEKMTRLTSLNLRYADRGMRLRAGDAADGLRGMC